MNTIVIVCDSLRMDDLAFYGQNDVIQTPNFDRLAADSATFSRCYAEGLPTVPVRTAFFTGRYTLPFRPWQPLEPDDVPIAEILWDQGYASALVTDTYHLHKPKMAFERGFDHVDWIRGREDDPWIATETVTTKLDADKYYQPPIDGDEAPPWGSKRMLELYMRNRSPWGAENGWKCDEDHFDAQVIKRSIDWLGSQVKLGRKDRLFLWADVFAPHDPIDPPPPFDTMYTKPDSPHKDLIMPLVRSIDGYLDADQLDHLIRLRWGFISFVDKWVGILIDWLRDQDMLDNTLVIWTTDHGDFFGEHGIIEKCRGWSYDILSHIPLLIRHPDGCGNGKMFDSFVQTPDIMPTILDSLGVEIPGHVQGKSVLPVMRGETESLQDFGISGWHGANRSIRNDRWSFHRGIGPNRCRESGMELYDLAADPGETNNLFNQHPDIAEQLDEQLERRMIELSES